MADQNREVASYLSAYEPSLRERIGNATYDVAKYLGLGGQANRMRDDLETAVDFIPGVGDAVGVNDSYREYQAGNYGMAAAGLGMTAIGTVPGVGDAASGALKRLSRVDYERAIAEMADKYRYLALRTVDQPIDQGNALLSRVWKNGDPTEKLLKGLSATDVNEIRWPSMHGFEGPDWSVGYYPGDYTYLVGSNKASIGKDAGELIMKDPNIILGGIRSLK